jgi:PAS domain S-box-containing protein
MNSSSNKKFKKYLKLLGALDTGSSNNLHYYSFFDSMSNSVEIIELIYDDHGQAVDYYIRDVNQAFAKVFNKTKEALIDQKITSLVDVLEDQYLNLYAAVDITGKSTSFKRYVAQFDEYYFVTVWKIAENRIGISFTIVPKSDTTEVALENKLEAEKLKVYTTINDLNRANVQLAVQNKEKDKRAHELILANKEKDKQAKEFAIVKELKQFIETSNTPVFGINALGFINEWNQASEKITGYKKEEVFGKDWTTLIPLKCEKNAVQIIQFALNGQQTSSFEFLTRSKEDKDVILLVNSSTRRDSKGNITGMLAVGQDITELVGYRNTLELRVEERTLKLNQALEKQKELNTLKSSFVSTASHEFRTPLSAINFAAGSLKKYWNKMEPLLIEKKLDKIEDQVLHMTRLLDDILLVGQTAAGKLKNNPIPTHLGEFIEEIIEEVHLSHNKSHQIKLIDTEDLKNSFISIDEKLGRNVFTNLISNAIKYSPNCEKISVEFSSEKNNTIIAVTDFGIGISPLELETIFTPFSRGQNVALIQGTGLGLTIVKEAIEVMKASITVKSSFGNGASFIVKIRKENTENV